MCKPRSLLKPLSSLCLLLTFSTGNFLVDDAHGGGYRQNACYVQPYVVREQQLILPVAVNPYYFSYNSLVAASNVQHAPTQQVQSQQLQASAHPQLQQQTDSGQYVTKSEFREFAEMLVAALENRDQQQYLKQTGGLDRRNVEAILEKNCKSCHSQPPEGNRPQLWVEGRLLPDDNLDWLAIDQLIRARIMPPKDHPPLPDPELLVLSKYASDVWILNRQRGKQQVTQAPGDAAPGTEPRGNDLPPPEPRAPTRPEAPLPPPNQNPNPVNNPNPNPGGTGEY